MTLLRPVILQQGADVLSLAEEHLLVDPNGFFCAQLRRFQRGKILSDDSGNCWRRGHLWRRRGVPQIATVARDSVRVVAIMVAVPVLALPYAIDLSEVARSVGKTSYDRGAAYARSKKVLSLKWDEDQLALTGTVVGSGLYTTKVMFGGVGAGIEFDYGECTCPIGFDCKHVAAVAVAAAGEAAIQPRGPRAMRAGTGSAPNAAHERVSSPAWQERLGQMVSGAEVGTTGSPLAIELSVAASSYARGKRLQAKLMRPGARGGWVNGSMSWNRLDPWDQRGTQLRADHLALVRDLRSVAEAHRGSRYLYSYSSQDRMLDLTDVDAGPLWSLLDEAGARGVALLDAGRGRAEIPRYRTAELLLDVIVDGDGAATVKPVLRDENPAGRGTQRLPDLFLGANGHGLVIHDRPGSSTDPSETGDLRLVRLARSTPEQLQLMVLGGERVTIPASDLSSFATQVAPALRNIAPVVSSDGSFTTPEVSAPALVLNVSHQPGHVTFLGWGFRYAVGDRTIDADLMAPHSGDHSAAIRDRTAERALLDTLDLDRPELRELGVLDAGGRPAAGTVTLEGLDTARFVAEELSELRAAVKVEVEETGEPAEYRDVAESLKIELSTKQGAGQQDWFDLDVTITVTGHELPFALVFAALARGETRLLLDDGAHFSLLAPELEALRELLAEAQALGDGSQADRCGSAATRQRCGTNWSRSASWAGRQTPGSDR